LSNIALHFAEQIRDSRIPLSKIDAVVNKHLGPARVRGNAQPNALYRQIAMYLGKHVGRWSTTQIGRFYNGRDHSTVCYAIRRIESLRRNDPAADALIVKLIELCRHETLDQPIQTPSAMMKALSDHLDNALIEEIVDRVADRIAYRLQSWALRPSSCERQME
jgi:hypothetical protein